MTIAMRVSHFFHCFQSLFSFPPGAPYTYLCGYIQNDVKVHFFCGSGWAPEMCVQMGKCVRRSTITVALHQSGFYFGDWPNKGLLSINFKPILNYSHPPKKMPLKNSQKQDSLLWWNWTWWDDWMIRLFDLNFQYPCITMYEEASHHLTNTASIWKHGGGECFSLDWRLARVEGENKLNTDLSLMKP